MTNPSTNPFTRQVTLLGRIRSALRRRRTTPAVLTWTSLSGDSVDQAPARLDFPPTDIWLAATTELERRWRVRACSKEPWTVEWILGDVRRGEILYDIGANVGAFSLIAARHVGAYVVAFEPGYANFARLCENIQLNECAQAIVPLPVALSERAELVGFTYRTVEPGQSRHRLHDVRWSADVDDAEKYVQPVATMPLDAVVTTYGLPPPHHLKIDVDGGELRVLRGAHDVLRHSQLRTVLIEADASLRDEVARLLTEAGLRLRSDLRRDVPGAPGYALFERTDG